jgi:N-acetylglucosaminyl-diphospho-decaprenol L-rhamnosyltransferase
MDTTTKSLTPELAVIIVSFNAGDWLERCVRSLEAELGEIPWELAVVDNASTDGFEERVPRLGSRTKIISNRVNAGFGRAANQGVAATRAPLVLFVNPDCEVLADSISRLCRELAEHEECAAAGPDILSLDGTRQGSARGDPDMLTGLFGRSTLLARTYPRLIPVRRNIRGPADLPTGATSMEVDWVSGACVLVRRSAFVQIGGFDERYFLYWEDADLGRRLRAQGSSVRYVPEAKVLHALGHSSRMVPQIAVREFHRSAYLYYTTHVVRSKLHPVRYLARLVLFLRCRVYLSRASRAERMRITPVG